MRYAIKGERPGTTIHAGGVFVKTNPIDGGAVLNEAQATELTKRGHDLVKVADVAPEPEVTEDAAAKAKIAVQRQEAAANDSKLNRPPPRAAKP